MSYAASGSRGRSIELVQSGERKVPLTYQWVGDMLLAEHVRAVDTGRNTDPRGVGARERTMRRTGSSRRHWIGRRGRGDLFSGSAEATPCGRPTPFGRPHGSDQEQEPGGRQALDQAIEQSLGFGIDPVLQPFHLNR